MTPAQFAVKMGQIGNALQSQVLAAECQNLQNADRAAVRLSSGPHSTAQLRAAGHPYARRRPNPAYDAAILNIQGGGFVRDWRTDGPRRGTGGIVSRLTNSNKVVKYLKGTKNTVARPVVNAIIKAVQPKRKNLLVAAVRAALRS